MPWEEVDLLHCNKLILNLENNSAHWLAWFGACLELWRQLGGCVLTRLESFEFAMMNSKKRVRMWSLKVRAGCVSKNSVLRKPAMECQGRSLDFYTAGFPLENQTEVSLSRRLHDGMCLHNLGFHLKEMLPRMSAANALRTVFWGLMVPLFAQEIWQTLLQLPFFFWIKLYNSIKDAPICAKSMKPWLKWQGRTGPPCSLKVLYCNFKKWLVLEP